MVDQNADPKAITKLTESPTLKNLIVRGEFFRQLQRIGQICEDLQALEASIQTLETPEISKPKVVVFDNRNQPVLTCDNWNEADWAVLLKILQTKREVLESELDKVVKSLPTTLKNRVQAK